MNAGNSVISQLDEEIIDQARTTRYPTPMAPDRPQLSREDKVDAIADHFRSIMEILGLNLDDASLKNTPSRVAKMYVEEIFTGLDPHTFPKICLFDDQFNQDKGSNFIFMKVNFSSFCEHHFVPMHGIASIAYIPRGKLLGFSTIPRIVQFFSKQPQIQERLTAQIADAISILTGSDAVAVSLRARHQCMIARATESEESYVITNTLLGNFEKDSQLRAEFTKLIG